MKKILFFMKRETVLTVAFVLALVSMFLVPPDRGYLSYIDYRTLCILYALMAIMNGFQKIGVFDWAARSILNRSKSRSGVILTLVLLCFFSSMLITNDVALITFVPLTVIAFEQTGDCKLLPMTVVLQTIAANLGSMLTPLGNPQNLYLYGKSGMSFLSFVKLMLPYSALSLILLLLGVFLLGLGERDFSLHTKKSSRAETIPNEVTGLGREEECRKQEESRQDLWNQERRILCMVYSGLFLLGLLTVLRVLPYPVMFLIVMGVLLITDLLLGRGVLKSTDLSLILTFTFLFVFIGNIGRLQAFQDFIQRVVAGHEVGSAVLASQVISNVPAAILLSGFTDQFQALIIGCNLGGLGTLIASMASLISFKYIARWNSESRFGYFLRFTLCNMFFLAILWAWFVFV
ncbi:MAG: anion permease [Lachnospiraceae bacterium]|nr:anion permease [Lachnospiraceae bacterium]